MRSVVRTRELVVRIRESTLWYVLSVQYRLWRRPTHVVVHGVRLTVDHEWGPPVLDRIYRKDYERSEARILQATLRPDDKYFEVGTGIGVITSVACKIVGEERVSAFEANPALVGVAARTATANGYSPEIINAVLGADTQTHRFYVRDVFLLSSLTPNNGGREVMVPGRSFLAELERTGATYLMLDIEGAEVDLLGGQLPSRVRGICVEMHPDVVGRERIQHLLEHLMAQGFMLDTDVSGNGVLFLARDSMP
jgi:FkbM family methyltransferase